MYKNLAATLVAACFISPAFSQSLTPLKSGFADAASVTGAHIVGMGRLMPGVADRLDHQKPGSA